MGLSWWVLVERERESGGNDFIFGEHRNYQIILKRNIHIHQRGFTFSDHVVERNSNPSYHTRCGRHGGILLFILGPCGAMSRERPSSSSSSSSIEFKFKSGSKSKSKSSRCHHQSTQYQNYIRWRWSQFIFGTILQSSTSRCTIWDLSIPPIVILDETNSSSRRIRIFNITLLSRRNCSLQSIGSYVNDL